MILNGAPLLCLIALIAVLVWAFWPSVRAFLGRITTDLFQDIPTDRGSLDDIKPEELIDWSVRRAGGSDETVAFTTRYHGGAA